MGFETRAPKFDNSDSKIYIEGDGDKIDVLEEGIATGPEELINRISVENSRKTKELLTGNPTAEEMAIHIRDLETFSATLKEDASSDNNSRIILEDVEKQIVSLEEVKKNIKKEALG